MNRTIRKNTEKQIRDNEGKRCPLRKLPAAVRVQLNNIDNLFDRICSGLAWYG